MAAERQLAAVTGLTERDVLAFGLALAGTFVAVAVGAAAWSLATGGSPWAAIHLALAGAAVVAIGAFMPHFAVTLAGTHRAASNQRAVALALLAGGASAVVVGTLAGAGWVAGPASLAVLGGLGLVATHTFAPLREPLARRHPVVTLVYAMALVELAVGVTLGGLAAAGVPAIVAAWATLRPAHAWLNLLGAVSLTIFGTLVYLAPTVLGARIRAGAGLAVGATGMLIGPPLAVAGFAVESRPLLVAGMALTSLGGLGQLAYLVDAYRRRGRFSSEHDWRAVSTGHLFGGAAWFLAAVVAATAEVAIGRPIAGWSIGALAVPLIAGWMLQELVGSWTYLVPSVSPGDAARHALQRRILAAAARSRAVAWNAGVALAWAGGQLVIPWLVLPGALLVGVAALASVLLLGRALATDAV
ncbi:MAG TPA: hypothetical protein VFM19_06780 [Candidatus Limnocylindria bacterium]|nr:hypothetical protein [Candidatus Limnocylindria bacterium]